MSFRHFVLCTHGALLVSFAPSPCMDVLNMLFQCRSEPSGWWPVSGMVLLQCRIMPKRLPHAPWSSLACPCARSEALNVLCMAYSTGWGRMSVEMGGWGA